MGRASEIKQRSSYNIRFLYATRILSQQIMPLSIAWMNKCLRSSYNITCENNIFRWYFATNVRRVDMNGGVHVCRLIVPFQLNCFASAYLHFQPEENAGSQGIVKICFTSLWSVCGRELPSTMKTRLHFGWNNANEKKNANNHLEHSFATAVLYDIISCDFYCRLCGAFPHSSHGVMRIHCCLGKLHVLTLLKRTQIEWECRQFFSCCLVSKRERKNSSKSHIFHLFRLLIANVIA